MYQRSGLRALCAVMVVFFLTGPASAQMVRWELGTRLQRFEQAWEEADSERRAYATPWMEQAVASFFRLRLADAASELDQAWFAVRRGGSPSELVQAALAWRAAVSPLLADVSDGQVRCVLQPFYATALAVADATPVRITLLDAMGMPRLTHDGVWAQVSQGDGVVLDMKDWLPGDYQLQVEIDDGGQWFELTRVGLSRVHDLDGQLSHLRMLLQEMDPSANASVRATMAMHLRQLEALLAGNIPECDIPAAHMLATSLALDGVQEDPGATLIQRAGEADLWLALADASGVQPVRLRAPASDGHTGKGWPVLILLHGAGGSENMFFETYGAGAAVPAGVGRGWLVVAPGQSMRGLALDLPSMLDALEAFFPIDRSRVFLLGHSMGAAQVVRQVARHPQRVRAAVALGGGGRAADAQALATVPWFIAAGDRDFGRRSAQALAQAIGQAQGAQVDYRVYDNVEHMVIVQAALPGAFAFLDQWATSPAISPAPATEPVADQP